MMFQIFSLVIEIRVRKQVPRIKHFYPRERYEVRTNWTLEEILAQRIRRF